MIRQLTGVICGAGENKVVLEVNDIGYLVFTNKIQTLGDKVTFYTHLAVRENALDLYGFVNKEELEVFELLLSLPKIGPKSALQILGQADISLLQQAVATQDPTYLTKMSGIGKKSAEKIVLGLKDKLSLGDYTDQDISINNTEATATIEALISLGYSEQIARETVQSLTEKEGAETNDMKIMLKEALKLLHR